MSKPDLQKLRAQLVDAKAAEAEAKAYREAVESAIYVAVAEQEFGGLEKVPSRGVVRANGIKIVLKENEKWDNGMLTRLSREIPPELWPFEPTWKCDARKRNKLAITHPELYRKIYPALTVKPAKPSFELVDEEPREVPGPRGREAP